MKYPRATIAAGTAAAVAALYAAYRWLFATPNGEPAPPTALPVLPHGGSGMAPAGDDAEALARVIASEVGGGTPGEQRAVGWVVRNRFRGKSAYKAEYPWRSQQGADPPFSSARGATAATRALAAEILAADQAADPTGGATAFFEPRMQDAFAKAGAEARAGGTGDRVIDGVKLTDITRFKHYRKNADEIRAKWQPGSALYATAGRFELWGSARALAARGGGARTIAGGLIGLDLLAARRVQG